MNGSDRDDRTDRRAGPTGDSAPISSDRDFARAVALEALALRRWALPLLTSTPTQPVAARKPPVVSAAAWRLFLRSEGCALEIDRVVRSLELPLDSAAATELERCLTPALQRALSAKGQLARMARTCQERGWKMAALKGGVAIAEGETTDVADVDVLVLPDVAPSFARELANQGYSRVGTDPPIGVPAWTHMAPRLAPGGIQVEVHYAVRGVGSAASVLERAIAVHGVRGLWRPSPEDQLFHLLWHGSVKHPARHGRIRDLSLLRYTLEGMTATEVDHVKSRVAVDPEGEDIGAVLRFVSAWSAGEQRSDPFFRTAALRYLVHALPAIPALPKRMERFVARSIYLTEREGGAVRRWIGILRNEFDAPASTGPLRRLGNHAPRLVTSIRRTYRTAVAVGTLPTAWKLVREAEELASRFESNG